MRLLVIASLGALVAIGCHQDGDTVRQHAEAALRARKPKDVPRAPILCGPGSAMAGAPGCNLDDGERKEFRAKLDSDLVEVVREFAIGARRHQNEITHAIDKDPAFIDKLLGELARKYGCGSAALTAQLENIFSAALVSSVSGKGEAAEDGLLPPGEVWATEPLSDETLERCSVLIGARPGTDKDVDAVVVGAGH